MKLLIGVLSNRDWKAEFGASMIELTAHLNTFPNIQTAIRPIRKCSSPSFGRQRLLSSAISEKFDYLLYIDDDMGFKPKALELLLSREKDFVAANCVTKTIPPESPTIDANGFQVFSNGKTGVEQVEKTGLAFALIKISAIANIPAPHFEVLWNEKTKDYVGEDIYFCDKLRGKNIDLFIDHDAARYLAHIGDFNYREPFTN